MKILIAYSTSEGQTSKIVDRVREWIDDGEHGVCVLDTSTMPDDLHIDEFDAFIIAGSVHYGKHQECLAHFVRSNLKVLQRSPSAFLSVSGSGSRLDESSQAESRKYIGKFTERTGWIPTTYLSVGGALKYTKYSLFFRSMLRGINASKGGPTDTSKDYEFTDWDELKHFIYGFLAEIEQCGSAVRERSQPVH